ncbi:MAG TPA: amino acid ABC transporter permease [Desulfomicrobiaceae bacterium]|nr:amino acid ABC transporter permease [Desulfomicrobiaceae bacterium]
MSSLSPSSTLRTTLPDICKYLLTLGALAWLIRRGADTLGYNWQWYQVPKYLYTIQDGQFFPGPLLDGLLVTIQISAVSLLCAFLLGLCTALLRLSGSVIGTLIARGYLEVIRNTPLLIQIFFIYFVLSPILDMSRFASAVLALSLFEGAYASEIFRAGVRSVVKGQWEAAYCLGLGTWQTYRRIILPQALRQIIPPLTSQGISLIKDSALVSTIAIYDLTMQGQAIVAESFLTFEIWFVVAAIYLCLTGLLSGIVYFMERRSMTS